MSQQKSDKMKRKLLPFFTLLLLMNFQGYSQNDTIMQTPATKKWYESIRIRGYAQLRYNGLFETNPDLGCEQCDKSWGGTGGFFFRRIRVIFFGQIHPRVYFYIQPDFASSPSSGTMNFVQIRDAYFDVGLDKKNEFRFRIGQSKVPFGFENLQSSQNRLPLDRNDPLNSALRNERDIGVFFYWAPEKIRKRFSMLVREGYKGSGDYGVFGLGIYNGQTASKPELNKEVHVVSRITYPFEIGSQIFEPGVQAYTGTYTIDPKSVTPGVIHKENLTYLDQRVGFTTVLYPRPIGLQAEYNLGVGPEFNKETNTIETKPLLGGYVTLNARIPIKNQLIYPFARMQYYKGGKKHERDARSYHMNEYEIGIEWLPYKNFEIVAMYTFSNRRYEDFILRDNYQTGSLLRLQLQVNF